jgi:hypothetical protein
MDINYEIIIKYLTNNKLNNKFITQKNIFNYSTNFPNKFKNLLNEKFYRYGISIYDNENNNISFWSSLLTIIDKNFIIPYEYDELDLINNFKIQLIDKYSKNLLDPILKKIDKTELRNKFKTEINIYILQYVVDILDINMFIFDFEKENIYSVYHNKVMNPLKQTILLATYQNYWEPIMMIKTDGTIIRTFDYNDQNIKKLLLQNDIKYFNDNKIHKINYDIFDIIQDENKINNNEPVKVIDDIFINKDETEEFKTLNKTKLTKTKINDLHVISNKLNIKITNKITKSTLIDLILSKINSL